MKKLCALLLLFAAWRCPAPILDNEYTTNSNPGWWSTNRAIGGTSNKYFLPVVISSPGFVGGGTVNQAIASNTATLGGAGNIANGSESIALAGHNNDAEGTNSIAAGTRSTVLHDGVFMWGDGQDVQQVSQTNNTFYIRALNGVTLRAPAVYYGDGSGLSNVVAAVSSGTNFNGLIVTNNIVDLNGTYYGNGAGLSNVVVRATNINAFYPGSNITLTTNADGSISISAANSINNAGPFNANQFSAGSSTNIKNGSLQTNNQFFGTASNTAAITAGSNYFGVFGGRQVTPGNSDFTNIYVGVNSANNGPGQWIAMPDQGGLVWNGPNGSAIRGWMGIHRAGLGLLLIDADPDIEIREGPTVTGGHPEINLGNSSANHGWIHIKTDSALILVTNPLSAAQGWSKAIAFDARGIEPDGTSTILCYPGIMGWANGYNPTNWVNDGTDGPTAPGGGQLRFYAHVPDWSGSFPFVTNAVPDHNKGLEIFRADTNGISVVSSNGGVYASQQIIGSNGVTAAGGVFAGNGSGLTNITANQQFVIYNGKTNVASLATSLVINIPHTMPNTNYTPSVSFMGSALAAAVAASYSSLTTTSFTLNLSAGISGGDNLTWIVIYSP